MLETKRRMSHQKLVILDYLRSVKTHPTAQEVYENVKKKLPTISLGTVYRNLNNLSTDKDILKIDSDNESHFDGNVCTHPHFSCKDCGRVYDLEFNTNTNKQKSELEKKGFSVDCVNIIYYGVCNKCLEVK